MTTVERGDVRSPLAVRTEQVAGAVDQLVAWISRHWLGLFNLIVAVFVGLPFLAPTLLYWAESGRCASCGRIGQAIYLIYRPTCHQLPERSFFLFGPQAVYTVEELEVRGALPPGLSLFQREVLRFAGSAEVGYKVTFCQRDVAIYSAILLNGLLFALLRGPLLRGRNWLPKMPLWMYGLLVLPMAIDGALQLVGLRESGWLWRLITGGLFGSATVWLAYPYVQEAMADVRRSLKAPPQTGQNRRLEV